MAGAEGGGGGGQWKSLLSSSVPVIAFVFSTLFNFWSFFQLEHSNSIQGANSGQSIPLIIFSRTMGDSHLETCNEI